MASFPLFVNLKNKKCLIVGAGIVAYRKIEILLRYDADIHVIAPEVIAPIVQFESEGRIRIERREYLDDDVQGAFLVIAATSSLDTNTKAYEEAVKRNIPVNVVDDPERCTFFFPSVIKRGDLTVGISTDGKYPALSKKLRKMMDETITEEYSEIIELLAHFRSQVREHIPSQGQRELVLKQVVEEFYRNDEITGEALNKLLIKYRDELK